LLPCLLRLSFVHRLQPNVVLLRGQRQLLIPAASDCLVSLRSRSPSGTYRRLRACRLRSHSSTINVQPNCLICSCRRGPLKARRDFGRADTAKSATECLVTTQLFVAMGASASERAEPMRRTCTSQQQRATRGIFGIEGVALLDA
jgi:hypothetical protein